MLSSYILLVVGFVIIFPVSRGVDPVDNDPDQSIETLQRQKKDVEPVELNMNVLDLATKDELLNLQEKTTTELSALTAELRALQLERQADPLTGSSVYVRWGSARCSNKSETVYSGVIGEGITAILEQLLTPCVCLWTPCTMERTPPAGPQLFSAASTKRLQKTPTMKMVSAPCAGYPALQPS